ncbi:ATP-binding protein [Paenibacillus sp. FSL R5-0517]|uniref:ATP-binding protein n=1 Tax=Paenibacillus sp. FSL R5-0517 TaxID=2921647 RepID=UPI0030DA1E15
MPVNKFRTKARAIELLGRKQIRDDITALIELIKNSYDADAEDVTADFNLDNTSPYIFLYDLGIGMEMDDILNKWLVLGTDSKKKPKNEKLSKVKSRRLMGEKGIGRLASAALGEQLWLFTKSQNERWHVLYLNWNIFENQDMYLEDVVIPLHFNKSKEEITSEAFFSLLIEEQMSNLKNVSWFDSNGLPNKKYFDLYERIKSQISRNSTPIDHLAEIVHSLDLKKQGTILLIQDLRHSWTEVFDTTKNREANYMASQRYNRLGSFIDSFNNTMEDFNVEMIVDNTPVKFNHFVDDELHELYDLKIKGKIENGKFFGQLFAINADVELLNACNNELLAGIEVTGGIMNPSNKDCGPFSLELCHYEKDLDKTGLTKQQIDTLNSRIGYVGGLKVYRDGVRILPYGDPENDFLNLEQNRSKNAGKYLFSHRNLFGKIELTSEDNPELEDKSSREGLIENEQFHYFVKTLQNLLVTIAVDFLSNKRKDSRALRESYVSFNQLKYEKQKKENEALDKEEKENKRAINSILKEIKEKKKLFNNYKINIREKFDLMPKIPEKFSYALLNKCYSELLNSKDSLYKIIDNDYEQMRMRTNPRFALNEEIQDEINIFNLNIDEDFRENLNQLEILFEEREKAIRQRMEEWRESVSKLFNKDFDRYVTANLNRLNVLREDIKDIFNHIEKEVNNAEKNVLIETSQLIKLENALSEIKLNIFSNNIRIQKELNQDVEKGQLMLEQFRLLEPHEINNFDASFSYLINTIEQRIDEIRHAKLKEVMNFFNTSYREILNRTITEISKLGKVNSINDLNELVGLLKTQNQDLKRENEIYADLANMGMAAEIVNHEFNQLLVNVEDGIKNIKNTSLNPTQSYWIRQIEAGFKAIGARHSQLSPMYRSYNLTRRNVKVYDLVEELVTFFAARLNQAGIKVENQVDKDFVLMLSPSKIYPVISNLIDNSIYWLLNGNDKIILFRSNIMNNSLYIEDSGPGITVRIQERVFEPFFSKRSGGRGLGLSIVKKVLESQGHTISLIQRPEEKILSGASFEIKFNENDRVG